MERDHHEITPWPLSSYDSLLQQFSQLSLPGGANSAAAAASSLPINNYSNDSWIAAFLQQRDADAAAAAADLHRLRVNSAVMGSNGYYWAPGSGFGPTRGYVDQPAFDQYTDTLLRRRAVMLANSGDYDYDYDYDYFSTAATTPNYSMNRIRGIHPVQSFDRTDFQNRYHRGSSSGGGRVRSSRNNSYSNNNNGNGNGNYGNGGGMISRNSMSLNETPLPFMETLPTWNDLRHKIASLCMDPKSCSVLQCMLAQGQTDGLEIAISEVKEDITEIITHQLGFVFFKRLIDCCDDRQFSDILHALMYNNRNFLDICLHSQGTYGVQRMIHKVNKDDPSQRAVVTSAIVPITVTLCKDSIASHVMIACLKAFEGVNDVIAPIMEEIANHCVEIAKDKSGCCVLQQCLAQPEGQVGRQRILSLIISNAYQLSEHEFGNYVVQYVIGMKSELTNMKVVKNLKGSLASLSKSKYGSHVVEKLLKDLRDDKVRAIINELTFDPVVVDIVQDPTGNYVAQSLLHRSRAMAVVSGHGKLSHQQLINRINNHYAFLHSHPYGKNVLNHLKCKCKIEDYDFNIDYM